MKPKTLLFVLLLCSLCWAAPQEQATSQASDTFYITHVAVIDTETGKESTDQTVVIAGDTISQVRDNRGTKPPAGAKVIDARGKYLIPGLWDMHVHGALSEWTYPLYLANGITGVREMWGPQNANEFLSALAAKKISAPHLYLGSPIVDGSPPTFKGSISVRTPEEARKVVDEQKRNGAAFIKVLGRLSRDSYLAIAEESKRQQIPFDGHVPVAVSAWEATAVGQRTVEHLYGIPEACSTKESDLIGREVAANGLREVTPLVRQAWLTYDEQKCQRLFSAFKKNHTWVVPTLTVLQSMSRLDDQRFIHDPRLRYIPQQIRDGWNPAQDFRFRGWTGADFATLGTNFDRDQKLVGAMFRAGVPMLAGTDVMNPFCFPGFSLHDELALLVESGVTPLGALQMATRNPAVFMNASDRYGTVAAGKAADLVLLDADPLADIGNTRQIRSVFVNGQYFDRAALDQLLATAERTADSAPEKTATPKK